MELGSKEGWGRETAGGREVGRGAGGVVFKEEREEEEEEVAEEEEEEEEGAEEEEGEDERGEEERGEEEGEEIVVVKDSEVDRGGRVMLFEGQEDEYSGCCGIGFSVED